MIFSHIAHFQQDLAELFLQESGGAVFSLDGERFVELFSADEAFL